MEYRNLYKQVVNKHQLTASICSLLLLLGASTFSFAQSDTLPRQNLKTIEIFSKGSIEKESSISLKQDSIAEKFQHNLNLAEKLNTNNLLFVKQYGQGILATPSLRGSNAQQVALIWEGVPIHSNLNGTSDLSLIPAELFSDLRLETGPGSALRGSSAMAGSITFANTQKPTSTTANNFYTISSSGINRFSGSLVTAKNRVSGRLGYAFDVSKNNFLYDSLGTNRQQIHAAQKGFTVLPEINFQINPKHSVYAKAWIQNM